MNRDSTFDSRTPATIDAGPSGNAPGWSTPLPERVPPPTVAPAALALGASLAGFGVVTSPILSIAGGVIAVGAVVVWIREAHHEHAR